MMNTFARIVVVTFALFASVVVAQAQPVASTTFTNCFDPEPPRVALPPAPQSTSTSNLLRPPRDALYARPIDEKSYTYFAVLTRHNTSDAAMLRLQRLRSCSVGVNFAVFPPVRPGAFWMVVSAAFASEKEAGAHVAFALRTGLAPRPEVQRYSLQELSYYGVPFRAHAPSVSPVLWPNYITPPGLIETSDLRAFVEIGIADNEADIATIARFVRDRFPGINVAVYAPRDPEAAANIVLKDRNLVSPDPATQWSLLLASNVSRDAAAEAVSLANRLGLDFRYFEERGPVVRQHWIPADRGAVAAARERRAAIERCYTQGFVTIESMLSCSGYLVSPQTIVTCLGNDQTNPIDPLQAARTLFEACSALPGTAENLAALAARGLGLETPLTIDVNLLPKLPIRANLEQCKQSAGTNALALANCVLPSVERFAKIREDLMRCLDLTGGGSVARCIAEIMPGTDYSSLLDCVVASERADASCLDAVPGADAVQQVQSCLQSAQDEIAAAACWGVAVPTPSLQQAIGYITCASTSVKANDYLGAASCIVDNEFVLKAKAAQECWSNAKDANVGLCLATLTGTEEGAMAACVAANTNDPLACVDDPNVAKARQAIQCAQSAADAASLIENCAADVGDEKTRRAAACVVRANGDTSKMAECAAQALLPGEAGRLAGCLASSQGATSFALCAAAPSMNEEWRIAAECAVSSGGEPISFVSCTGGRLTVRELIKCVNGEIGKDCFGPNNTIRVYYETTFNDMKRLLSGDWKFENNDIVKGGEAVAKEIGNGLESTNNWAKDAACTATFGAWCP